MRILYYVWNEFTGEDCRMVMRELGHEVIEFRCTWNRFDDDPEFEQALEDTITLRQDGDFIDCVFTWNFFPIISRVCHRLSVPYISWVFDSPHFPLASVEVCNPENHIHVFDRALVDLYRSAGVDTVSYSPLAINSERLRSISDRLDADGIVYEHDVTFLGNLYDNEYNFYEYAAYHMPDELRSFFEKKMEEQRMTYDRDLIGDEEVVSRDRISELNRYMKFKLSEDRYDFDQDILIRDILKKKVTQDERRILLEDLAQKYKVDLYTKADGPTLNYVRDLGQADYMNRMPHVFHRSRINLNFMMRSIRTGMSLRVLDVLGVGGFLLTTWRSELDEYFADGEDMVIAHRPEDFTELIGYYLRHDDERREIARRGQAMVLEKFDYRSILPGLLRV